MSAGHRPATVRGVIVSHRSGFQFNVALEDGRTVAAVATKAAVRACFRVLPGYEVAVVIRDPPGMHRIVEIRPVEIPGNKGKAKG